MAAYYEVYSFYSSLKKSAECAFGINWETLPLSEKLPEEFRRCLEESISAMKRAKLISDLVIARREVEEKQKELKKAEVNLKNLKCSVHVNTESANQ